MPKTQEVQILFHRRNAPSRGPTSSKSINDMMDEVSHDLGVLQVELNDSLVPAMAGLPDGTIDTEVDAFTNGLDGKNMYVNANSTATVDSDYFNINANRPNTIYEELANIYADLSALGTTIETSIANFSQQASDILITDTGGLYASITVETALTEVMDKVNLLALGQVDLAAIDDHYIPTTTDTYDLGTIAIYLRDVYTNKVNLLPLAGAPSSVEGRIYYDDGTKKLYFYNGTTWKEVATV